MKNAITIDLEDYYQVSAFSGDVAVDQWESFGSRIEDNTARLLAIFDDLEVKATFFILGWVARKHQRLVAEIAERGHEIACHSNAHRSVYEMAPHEFRADTIQAQHLLEDITGRSVSGYRAPSFSITSNSLWAFEILAELGFLYDSSIFPVRHPNYGWPRAPRFPFSIKTGNGSITEFPMSTLELAGMRAPVAGGAYLRLLPYWYTRWSMQHINKREQRSACVYLHPWELDVKQPRMSGSISARLRHYFGLRGAETKFRRLLGDFEVRPLRAFVEDHQSNNSSTDCVPLPEFQLSDFRLLFWSVDPGGRHTLRRG